MTNQRTYADAFTSVFKEEKAFLDFLREREKFIEHSVEKVRELRALIEQTGSKALIEVALSLIHISMCIRDRCCWLLPSCSCRGPCGFRCTG